MEGYLRLTPSLNPHASKLCQKPEATLGTVECLENLQASDFSLRALRVAAVHAQKLGDTWSQF